MENYSTNREAGLQYAHNPTDSPSNGEIEEQIADVNRDYGFALPSTDNNIQVRYVDRRNDSSSRPYWLLIDNTVPKYDPLHGLQKKDQTTEAVANPNVSTPLTLAAVQDGATGPASHTSGIAADGTDSAAYDASNDEKAENLDIAADVTGGSSAVATDGSENTSISDTEKEKSSDSNGPVAATTESRGATLLTRLQPFRATSTNLILDTSEPDEDVFDTMATPPTPRPGTARANRLARAAARQATLARLNTGANVVVSAEAEQIAQQAQTFRNYNVNEAVALVRINQDLGLRVRNPNLTHAPVADDTVKEVEENQDSHGKSAQNLATADEALVIDTESSGPMSTTEGNPKDVAGWKTSSMQNFATGFDSDQDSELSDPPTDLESEGGQPRLNKNKSRSADSDLEQADFDTNLETDLAIAASEFEDSGYEAQNESGEDYESMEQIESQEDSEDEWKPLARKKSSRATALPRKKTKKASKTKKNSKTDHTKSYLCPWPACGQRFGRKDHLKRHWGSHSDTKSFRCPAPFCGHATKRKDNLKEHLKLRHNLGATAAKRGVDQAARAAVAETQALAAAVNAAIASAEGSKDSGASGKTLSGSGRSKKRRSGAATSSSKAKAAISSEDARKTGTVQQAAVDYEAQADDKDQSGTMYSNRGERLGSGDDGDIPGTALLRAAYEVWDSDRDFDRNNIQESSDDDDDHNDINEMKTVRKNLKRRRGEGNDNNVGNKTRNGKPVEV
ncbi:hypothetical protein SLS60_004608 [Paraconiothyrium brasiliense]|uniref:C2H2-type domain-containing protein n=1 Tax=Paraconiothyrium brasiliense TaxID=300254 RepID=A0ABR3RKV3_9PLEO